MLFLSQERALLSLLYKLDVIVLKKEKLQKLISKAFVPLPWYVEEYYCAKLSIPLLIFTIGNEKNLKKLIYLVKLRKNR